MKVRIINIITIILFVLIVSSCQKKNEIITNDTRVVLGTVCTISLYEKGSQDVYDILFDRLAEIEKTMSVNIADTEVSAINNLAGIEEVEISYDTYTVLLAALDYAHLTKGAFNPAIGPLVKLWSIGTDDENIPTQISLERSLPLSNWEKVKITENNNSYFAFLEQEGMSLDLGGVAKGFAADELVKILKEQSINSALIDLGGNIYALGEKENGDPWRVGIKNPFDSTGAPVVRVDLKNQSVVTSGVYERFFELDGNRYHHLLDSKTGYPADNGLMSVTIVTESSMLADVLSTAVFVLGQEDGMNFLNSIGEKGFCINNKKEVISTENLRGSIVMLDDSFTLLK